MDQTTLRRSPFIIAPYETCWSRKARVDRAGPMSRWIQAHEEAGTHESHQGSQEKEPHAPACPEEPSMEKRLLTLLMGWGSFAHGAEKGEPG